MGLFKKPWEKSFAGKYGSQRLKLLEKAFRALDAIKDQQKLGDIALDHSLESRVREHAATLLTDSKQCLRILLFDLSGLDVKAKKTLLDHIGDPADLTKIAKSPIDFDIRCKAYRKITDPAPELTLHLLKECTERNEFDGFTSELVKALCEKDPALLVKHWPGIKKKAQAFHEDSRSQTSHDDGWGSHQDASQATVLGSADCHTDTPVNAVHNDAYPNADWAASLAPYIHNAEKATGPSDPQSR